MRTAACASRWRWILDESIKSLLNDLGEALLEAVSGSPDVSGHLLRLQESGYTLYLSVDCKRDSPGAGNGAGRVSLNRSPPPSGEPVFKINTGDLAFLRSIGIDPTRKSRSRRP